MLQKEVIKIEAITREETLLQSIAEGKEVTLEPKTRLEWWLKKIAESGGSGGVSSWNDLPDKPFYKEETEFNIEWDGDTTGKIVLGDGALVKVSDLVPSDEEAKNGTITFIADGEEQTIKVSELRPFGDDNFLSLEAVIIVKKDNYTSDMWGCTFPEKGVYFMNEESIRTSSFSSKSTVIKTLDKEFLPKPLQFGKEESLVEILPETTLTCTEDNMVFTSNDIVLEPNKTYKVIYNGTEYLCDSTETTFMETPCIVIGNLDGTGSEPFAILYAPSENMTAIQDFNGLLSITLSITRNDTVIKTIDKEFLPTIEEQLSNTSLVNYLEWNGDTTGKETVDLMDNGSDIFAYVSEIEKFTIEDLYGGIAEFKVDSQKVELELSDSNTMSLIDNVIMIVSDGVAVAFITSSENIQYPLGSGVFTKKGVWIRCLEGASYKLTVNKNLFKSTTYTKISKEYLPTIAEQLSNISYTNVIEWDKDTTGKEQWDNTDEIMYKVAEPPVNVTLEDFIDCKVTYTSNDGSTEVQEYGSSVVMDMNSQIGIPCFSINNDIAIILEDCEMNGIELTKGIYFSVNKSNLRYISKLETVGNIFTTGTCDKIPEESIPELHHLILVSPNGTKFKVGIADTGEMTGELYTE